MACSGFYGLYVYLVTTLGGLYIAADFLLLYSIFWSRAKSAGGNSDCEYPMQKVWMVMWQVLNLIAIIGLLVALGWYCHFGMWAMLHVPVHFVVFLIICLLVPLLIYTAVCLYSLQVFLREQYIDSVLGQHDEEEDAGLTQGGRRVSI